MNRNSHSNCNHFCLASVLRGRPHATANLQGNDTCPDITGCIRFYQTNAGVVVYAQVKGLPSSETTCHDRIFAFHIHDGSECSGSMENPFSAAGAHYDPHERKHPCHAGDLPPLFGNDGMAVSAFLTNRFNVQEVIGKTVIIHDQPDDFTTQPAGNAGTKIACGVIRQTSWGN